MACAHGIDVKPFHDLDILDHTVQCDDIATVGIHLVAVGTFDIHGLAIDEELTVLDLYLTEADFLRDDLYNVTFTVFHDGFEGEEIRCLCCPTLHIAHHETSCTFRLATEVSGLLGYDRAIGIEQSVLHNGAAFDPSIDEQLAVFIVIL